MTNEFSTSMTDSCSYLNNANRVLVKLTMSPNAKRNNNIVPKMINQKGQSLK